MPRDPDERRIRGEVEGAEGEENGLKNGELRKRKRLRMGLMKV